MSAQEREAAILETAERLLEERSVQDISVDDLARGAGISRPSFYFYFPSKEAVFLTLIDRLVEQAEGGREVIDRIHEDPRARWREGLQIFFDIFGAHRAVVRAGSELRAVNAEARELWSGVMEKWVGYAAERDRGRARPRRCSRRGGCQAARDRARLDERARPVRHLRCRATLASR